MQDRFYRIITWEPGSIIDLLIRNVRRGLIRVKELLSSGVNITYASNNVCDALRPMGNFDLLEEGLMLAYGAHMDSVDELNTIMKMSTYNGARMLGL